MIDKDYTSCMVGTVSNILSRMVDCVRNVNIRWTLGALESRRLNVQGKELQHIFYQSVKLLESTNGYVKEYSRNIELICYLLEKEPLGLYCDDYMLKTIVKFGEKSILEKLSPTSIKDCFRYAIEYCKKDMLRWICEKRQDVLQDDIYGKPCLVYATSCENAVEIMDLLRLYGADVNAKDKQGKSCLMYVIGYALGYSQYSPNPKYDLMPIIEWLCEHGASKSDINIKDRTGKTYLMCAIESRNKPLVELLCKCGADVNAKDCLGVTYLMYAIRLRDELMVRLLCAHGANINMKDSHGKSCLMYAIEYSIGYSFEKESNITPTLWGLGYALLYSVIGCSPDYSPKYDLMSVIELLCEHGASKSDINEKHSRTGETYLMHAIQSKNEPLAKLLCKCGANVNAGGYLGKTYLMYVIESKNEPMVRLLCGNNADVNAKDNKGKTCLMYAIEAGHMPVIELLYKYGANVSGISIQDGTDRTYLMRAIESKNEPLVKLLCEYGANVNAKDKKGKTCLMYAIERSSRQTIELLLQKGVDPNEEDADKKPCLMYAIEADNEYYSYFPSIQEYESITDLLLRNPINVQLLDDKRRTYLIRAVMMRKTITTICIINSLCAHEKDIDHKDVFDNTALDYAITQGDIQGNSTIATFLVKKGATYVKEAIFLVDSRAVYGAGHAAVALIYNTKRKGIMGTIYSYGADEKHAGCTASLSAKNGNLNGIPLTEEHHVNYLRNPSGQRNFGSNATSKWCSCSISTNKRPDDYEIYRYTESFSCHVTKKQGMDMLHKAYSIQNAEIKLDYNVISHNCLVVAHEILRAGEIEIPYEWYELLYPSTWTPVGEMSRLQQTAPMGSELRRRLTESDASIMHQV